MCVKLTRVRRRQVDGCAIWTFVKFTYVTVNLTEKTQCMLCVLRGARWSPRRCAPVRPKPAARDHRVRMRSWPLGGWLRRRRQKHCSSSLMPFNRELDARRRLVCILRVRVDHHRRGVHSFERGVELRNPDSHAIYCITSDSPRFVAVADCLRIGGIDEYRSLRVRG